MTLFKERIHNIDYTPIIIGPDMMKKTTIIEKLNAQVKKFGEKLKHKRKVQSDINSSTNLEYMYYPKHGY